MIGDRNNDYSHAKPIISIFIYFICSLRILAEKKEIDAFSILKTRKIIRFL